jgi:hypothetical protein
MTAQPCRCGHSIFRHYDEDQGANCTACGCPEYRCLETIDSITLGGTEPAA